MDTCKQITLKFGILNSKWSPRNIESVNQRCINCQCSSINKQNNLTFLLSTSIHQSLSQCGLITNNIYQHIYLFNNSTYNQHITNDIQINTTFIWLNTTWLCTINDSFFSYDTINNTSQRLEFNQHYQFNSINFQQL